MQRPVMNPMFCDGEESPAPRPPRLARVWSMVRKLPGLLLADVFFWRNHPRLKVEIGTPAGRFMRGLLYRAIFVPVLLVLIIGFLVYMGTHPSRTLATRDPQSEGIYYDPVSLVSGDGVQLDAWLVPLIDARRVLAEGEQVLRVKRPAVILVHDYGASRQQMLPLVRPLHDAGFVVLAINLRGSGSSGSGACTFGLNESFDVQAAIEMLRRRAFVAPDRISIVGVGTGASAAIVAASRDPMVAALALDHPLTSIEQAVADYISPEQSWLTWTRPVSRWAFELSHGVDAAELERSLESMRTARRPLLIFDGTSSVRTFFCRAGTQQLTEFLLARTSPPSAGATAGLP